MSMISIYKHCCANKTTAEPTSKRPNRPPYTIPNCPEPRTSSALIM